MARDHARIRLDIWADDDFRALTSSAQWLYFHLTSNETLSFCGVADWRPARIAPKTAELSPADVEAFGEELQHGLFVIIDHDTEEALVRSWVKHDGLMKSPNLAKALAKAHAATASAVLRAVVIHELKRLKADWTPTEKADGWSVDEVKKLIRKRSISPEEGISILSGNPSGNPSENPSAKGSGNPSATPLLLNSLSPISIKSNLPYDSDDLDLDSHA
jgi:hypothetical protein